LKVNKFIWISLCVFNRYILRTLVSNKSISTPININGNISYEGILKPNKFRRCDSLVSFFIYHESWRGNCPWIVFIQNNFTFSVITICSQNVSVEYTQRNPYKFINFQLFHFFYLRHKNNLSEVYDKQINTWPFPV
jgi:hypothetical protein